MTLDEIVKRSKTAAKSSGVSKGISRRGGRGAKGSLGARPVRRGPLAVNARQSSFSINKASFKI